MRYEVVWTTEGLEQLLAIIGRIGKSGDYVRALAEINGQLGVDPRPADATVNEDLWRVTVGKIRVYYEINDEMNEVEIVGIRSS